MNSYCSTYAQNCYYNCCDYYGVCPSSSYDCYCYYSDSCFYNYSNNTYNSTRTSTSVNGGSIAGMVVGGIVLVAIIIGIYLCCRKKNALPNPAFNNTGSQQSTVIIPGGGYTNPVPYGNPPAQIYNDPYYQPAAPIMQPMQPMQQPYGQPYAQPYGNAGYGNPPVIITNM